MKYIEINLRSASQQATIICILPESIFNARYLLVLSSVVIMGNPKVMFLKMLIQQILNEITT